MKIEQLGEWGLIERIRKGLLEKDSRVVVGVGDDCCGLEVGPGRILIATTDSFVEGVHFDLSFFSYHLIGVRSLSAALSDIAAMGGVPICGLISLFLPRGFEVEAIDELYDGLRDVGESHRVSICGGDVVRAPHLCLTVTVVGEVEKSNLALRSGAKVGDSVCVTGALGGAEAGLMALKSSLEIDEEVSRKHLSPVPRLKEARVLLESCEINSMIDLSDGIASDINHIAQESAVGAKIYGDKVPIAEEAQVVAAILGRNPLDLALYGGEDFELLFTLSKEQLPKAIDALRDEVGIREIGEITPQEEGVVLTRGEKTEHLPPKGYDHFPGARGNRTEPPAS